MRTEKTQPGEGVHVFVCVCVKGGVSGGGAREAFQAR